MSEKKIPVIAAIASGELRRRRAFARETSRKAGFLRFRRGAHAVALSRGLAAMHEADMMKAGVPEKEAGMALRFIGHLLADAQDQHRESRPTQTS